MDWYCERKGTGIVKGKGYSYKPKHLEKAWHDDLDRR